MNAWVGIVLVAAASGLTVIGVLVAASRRANRSPDVVAAMGAMLDMEYSPRKRSIPWMAFRTLRGFGAFVNVLDGERDGIRVVSAQAIPTSGSSAYIGVTGGADRGFAVEGETDPASARSVAMAVTPPLPAVVVVRRGPLNQVADRLASTSVDLELEAFNRSFYVRADERKDAYTVLQQPLMEWLRMTDERLSFETGANGILVSAPLLPPDEIPMLVATARGFATRIPRTATLT